MAAVANTVQVTATDRLGFSLFFATILHAMVILGIGFGVHFSGSLNQVSMLEVTMVLTKTHQTPSDAKHIASENQLASGSTDLENQPSAPFTGTSLIEASGVAPVKMSPNKSQPSEVSRNQELLLTQETSESKVNTEETFDKKEQTKPRIDEVAAKQQLELAKLVAELRQEQNDYAKRPRINYIDTLSAKTAAEASYVREWVEKVERIGNLNYPDEARRKHLSGTLILSVLLNNDGKIVRMEIQSSAGKSILDEAAKKIVRIAAPFQAFPEEMHDNYDQLMITRTWLFGKDNTLLTK